MTNNINEDEVKRIIVKSHLRLTRSGKQCWVHSYYRNIRKIKDKPNLTSIQSRILAYKQSKGRLF